MGDRLEPVFANARAARAHPNVQGNALSGEHWPISLAASKPELSSLDLSRT